jgi:5-methylcytosine-specific restriction endonuclease McrA
MPIRPEERDRYPKDWRQIRGWILARAGNRCEGSPAYPDCRAENDEFHPITGSIVVLTIAHLDHTPENVDAENLRAWCQRCHLTYDARHHAKNAAATRRRKLGNLDLFPDGAP